MSVRDVLIAPLMPNSHMEGKGLRLSQSLGFALIQ